MRAIKAIALSTFKEAVRDKVFYNLVIFAFIFLGASRILGMVSSGQDLKIMMDVGLGCISIFGLIVAVIIGASLIHKEIERGTIQVIMVKPISRHEYIIGKYLGLLMTILLNLLIMTIGFYLILRPASGTWNFLLLQGIFLIFMELMIVTAIAVMFSSFSSPLLSVILTFCCFAMGQLSNDFLFISEKLEVPALKIISKFIYNIIPHLSDFNIKNELVYGITVSNEYIISTAAYGLAYASIIVFVTIIIFKKRNFK